jgi:hypothetical protein
MVPEAGLRLGRHSDGTPACRLTKPQAQKNQLNSWFRDGTRGRASTGPTLGRYASVPFIQTAGTKKPTK